MHASVALLCIDRYQLTESRYVSSPGLHNQILHPHVSTAGNQFFVAHADVVFPANGEEMFFLSAK